MPRMREGRCGYSFLAQEKGAQYFNGSSTALKNKVSKEFLLLGNAYVII